MHIQTLTDYFAALMKGYSLSTHLFIPEDAPEFDMGLRRLAGVHEPDLIQLAPMLRPNAIYRILDPFGCRFFMLRLPHDNRILLTGPYLRGDNTTEQLLLKWIERHQLPPSVLPVLRQTYQQIPVILDETPLLVSLSAFGEMLWGSPDAFTMEDYEDPSVAQTPASIASMPHISWDDEDLRRIERRYDGEEQLIHAVSQGLTHQASLFLSGFRPDLLETRTTDSLRNIKNYIIVLNVLLRKAAQKGSVHPFYIDQLSSSMAQRIEQLPTVSAVQQFMFTMVHKYCLLVKNHTMRGYSQPVQGVILRVDADLTANLSLQAHADHLGVNASYLSSLFKRETGMTLTEYVNRKRIDNAIYLLNATQMQIQTIAQHCGIPDVNYFTKTFKHIIGQTPTEYRRLTRGISKD